MSENNVKVIGGPVLGNRREHNYTLVDAVMHYDRGGQAADEGSMLGS